jgi:hypothetical protein
MPERALPGWTDHSNTQFAVLGLWVAQRHGRGTRIPLARLDRHYREDQHADGGWAYRPGTDLSTLANTCSGLLALAAGHGINSQTGREARPLVGPRGENDRAVARGLERLAHFPLPGLLREGGRAELVGLEHFYELYTLWSVERVATLYDLKTIGDREWYPGVAYQLVRAQHADGQWHHGRGAPIDTAFALLVLRRSNLLPDLTAAIQGKDPAGTRFPAAGGTARQPAPLPAGVTRKPQPIPSPPSAAATLAPAMSATAVKAAPERVKLPTRMPGDKNNPEQP